MAKSLNRVQLIGNLTRDPELRYTPSGAGVCSFGIATNRSWTTDTGEKREEVEFHNIVAWRKLAEICSQYLKKGSKVFVEGRLATRSWTSPEGQPKTKTEIVIDDMIMLGGRGDVSGGNEGNVVSTTRVESRPAKEDHVEPKEENATQPVGEEVAPDDIPF
jgi:single-strand DNA-binding protein